MLKLLPKRIISIIAAISLLFYTWGFSPLISQAETESIQPYLDRVIEQVTEFRLDNGMKFIVLENHDAPVVSFVTYADVGGSDEPKGKTGIAHFLEHLAFKGTERIGTTDYQQEKVLLDQLDQIYAQIKLARKQGNQEKLSQLEAKFQEVEAKAAEYVKQNEFGQIVDMSGGVGLNATTSADATNYFYSFPSNKLELWMSLESERFLEPVFREFFREQQVILEERKLRVDNSPIGQLVETFLEQAFVKHPYKYHVIGLEEDILGLTRQDIQEFFDIYYVPNNLTIAIVGDVDPAQVQQLANIYFGRYQAGPNPPQVTVVEPPQTEPRNFTLELASQPWYMEGYHRPNLNDPDNAVYETITSIMSSGLTSRLYKSLVEEQKVALSAQGFNGFPGDKYANLIVFYATTAPNASLDDVAQALHQEIERLKTEPVSESELEQVKTKLRASLLRSLNSNMGLARSLAEYEVKTGSWRNLFKQLDKFAAVTPEDIQRVAKQTFRPENRTTGVIVPKE